MAQLISTTKQCALVRQDAESGQHNAGSHHLLIIGCEILVKAATEVEQLQPCISVVQVALADSKDLCQPTASQKHSNNVVDVVAARKQYS